jgi:hypothetical protein
LGSASVELAIARAGHGDIEQPHRRLEGEMRPPRRLDRKHGHVWEVRWREDGRHRSRVFALKRDAELFKMELWRARRLGPLAESLAADQTLAEFCSWRWRVHVKANLESSTSRRYRQVLHRHLSPHLGDFRVREITPPVVAEFRADLAERGVPNPTARKVLFVRAVDHAARGALWCDRP